MKQNIQQDVVQAFGEDFFADKVFLPSVDFQHCTGFGVIPEGFVEAKKSGKIEGRKASIEDMEANCVVLNTGEKIEADVIISACGFAERFPFFSDEYCQAMNLPNSRNSDFNLYRRVVPVGIPKIAFVGFIRCLAQWMVAETASHWISSYFLGHLKLPSEEKMQEEKALVDNHIRSRIGKNSPHFTVYWIEPMEIYLQDMGLSVNRTSNFWKENFQIFTPSRLATLTEERRSKVKGTYKPGLYWSFEIVCATIFVFTISIVLARVTL